MLPVLQELGYSTCSPVNTAEHGEIQGKPDILFVHPDIRLRQNPYCYAGFVSRSPI